MLLMKWFFIQLYFSLQPGTSWRTVGTCNSIVHLCTKTGITNVTDCANVKCPTVRAYSFIFLSCAIKWIIIDNDNSYNNNYNFNNNNDRNNNNYNNKNEYNDNDYNINDKYHDINISNNNNYNNNNNNNKKINNNSNNNTNTNDSHNNNNNDNNNEDNNISNSNRTLMQYCHMSHLTYYQTIYCNSMYFRLWQSLIMIFFVFRIQPYLLTHLHNAVSAMQVPHPHQPPQHVSECLGFPLHQCYL